MATSSVDDDLHGTSIDALFGVEDVAMLVFVLLVLKCQDLGDNESGARIIVTKDLVTFIFIHALVLGHVLKRFHVFLIHGFICAIVVGDHGVSSGALKCRVVSTSGVVNDEALGLKLLVVGGRLEDVKVFL